MSARLIVAYAGPLIALAVGGVLPLSVGMLGGLSVPETVLQEWTADPSAPGAAIIDHMAAWGVFRSSRMPVFRRWMTRLRKGWALEQWLRCLTRQRIRCRP